MAPSFFLLLLVSSSPLVLAAAAADGQGGEPCPTVPVPCGEVNITFPFAIVPDEATEASCGAIGFQVICLNNTPYLGYNRRYRAHQLQILHIFYDNASLLVADAEKLEDFNSTSERCHAPSNNSSSKLGLPFSISAMNRDLIMYNCAEPLPEEERRGEGLVEMSCGNRTFARVADDRSDGDPGPGGYGSYFLEGCNATVVPVLARSGEANASNYKELISDGFLLTWPVPKRGTLPGGEPIN